jgi:hypothetical protein
MRRRHERSRLFVTGQDQLDLRIAQRLDNVEVFLARHTEDAVNPFVLQCRDQKVRALYHFVHSLLSIDDCASTSRFRQSCALTLQGV